MNTQPAPNPSPGKFETSGVKGELFWAMSMDGVDEEAGDVAEGMWAAVLRGPFLLGELAREFPQEYVRLNEDDKDDIARAKGAIISEDDQGFVELHLFANGAELSREWNELADELDRYGEPGEETAEGDEAEEE